MVVDQDHACRVEPHSVTEQLPHPHERRRDVALVHRRHAKDVVLGIEHHDPQLFALQLAHLEDQTVGDIMRSADRPPGGRPVGQQPPAQLECRGELGRACRSDPTDDAELDIRGAREPDQAVVAGEGIGCDVDRRSPARTGPPDEPDELR
jgi:hypothetical protein